MSLEVFPPSLPNPLEQLRIRMIQELEGFLSVALRTTARGGASLCPGVVKSSTKPRTWYHRPVPPIAGEKTSC
jgi:hypothetical protein